jgi:hypothetical protein
MRKHCEALITRVRLAEGNANAWVSILNCGRFAEAGPFAPTHAEQQTAVNA